MHDRGLKLGIYGDMGTHTCGGYPGTTLDKIEIDAQTFADWEVDMFKFDGCYSNATEQEQGMEVLGELGSCFRSWFDCKCILALAGYPLMSKALNATGRPIGYSCSWPAYRGGLPPKVILLLTNKKSFCVCYMWDDYLNFKFSVKLMFSGKLYSTWGDLQPVA